MVSMLTTSPHTHNLLFASARSCLRKRENSRRHFLSPFLFCLIMLVLLLASERREEEEEEKKEDFVSQSMCSWRKKRRVWVVALSEQEKASKSEGGRESGEEKRRNLSFDVRLHAHTATKEGERKSDVLRRSPS